MARFSFLKLSLFYMPRPKELGWGDAIIKSESGLIAKVKVTF